MSAPTIETDRLVLRALHPGDWLALRATLGRADVMTHYVDLAFTVAKLPIVYSCCVVPNVRSRRVLEKLGMTWYDAVPYTSIASGASANFLVYSLTADDWQTLNMPGAARSAPGRSMGVR